MATRAPTATLEDTGQPNILWDQLEDADTATEYTAWPGGKATFAVYGTFDSASVTIDWAEAGGSTFVPLSGSALTANGCVVVDIPPGQIKPVATGGGLTQDVDIRVQSYRNIRKQ